MSDGVNKHQRRRLPCATRSHACGGRSAARQTHIGTTCHAPLPSMMPSHPPAQPARYDSTPALARTDHAPWRALRSPEAPQRSHTTCCCRVHTLLLSAPRTGCPSTCHRSLRMPTPTHNAMPPAQNTPPRTHLHRPHRIPRALSTQTPRLRRHPCLDTPSRTL